MRRWWVGLCLGLLVCTATMSVADDRRGSPFGDDHWQGTRTWRPDRDRRWRGSDLPDRVIMGFFARPPKRCISRMTRSESTQERAVLGQACMIAYAEISKPSLGLDTYI
jgi:hypothetical protein